MDRDTLQGRWILRQGWLPRATLIAALRHLQREGEDWALAGDLCGTLLERGLLTLEQAQEARRMATKALLAQIEEPPGEKQSITATTIERPPSHLLRRRSVPMAAPESLPRALQARYQILDRISEGKMGALVKARSLQSGALVAIKYLSRFHPDLVTRTRFQSEARVLERLAHPHIIPIVESGFADDTLYYVMEYVDGIDLDRLIKEHPPQTHGRTLKLYLKALSGVAGALVYCHERDIVHRDVKPQNIMFTDDLTHAYLVDFGLMKERWQGPGEESSMGLTDPDDIVGTPAFMAPEQLMPGSQWGEVGPAVDVWGLGATLYYCVTGIPPFNQGSVVEIFRSLATAEVLRLRQYDSGLPDWLDELCARCLEKRSEARPSMEIVAASLKKRSV